MSYSTGNNHTPMPTAFPVEVHPIPVPQAEDAPTVTERGNKYEQEHMIAHNPQRPLDEHQIQTLMGQGYTRGLCMSLNQMKEVFARRFWIIDNSKSMQIRDGHRIVPTHNPNVVKMVQCSRWEEIQECVEYHIKMAGLIEAPTRFRFLNNPGADVGPQTFSVAEDPTIEGQDVQKALAILRKTRPEGCTPLKSHIQEIRQEVSQMGPELRRLGKKVVIVIATDGLPTDERGYTGNQHNQEFVESLRLLEGLPVWVLVRLCTDEEEVVNFYNDLDNQLELSLEVLDDFSGEAIEVTGENPWLNYGLPLHRLREMGYHDRVFDMLDERPLTKTELRDFCALLFGEENFDGVSDPSLDWQGFMGHVDRLLRREAPQYDPVKRRLGSWINIREMNRVYTSRGGCGTCSIM